MKDFRKLKVWEKSHALTLAIYKATDKFPKQELYALTNQIQRAAVSIPANIAEDAAKTRTLNSRDIFKLLWDLPVNSNTCSCWPMILVIFPMILMQL